MQVERARTARARLNHGCINCMRLEVQSSYKFCFICRTMLKRTQKMVLDVFRRAQAETHVLFKVNMSCCPLGHSTITLSSLHMHPGLSYNELGDCRRSISVDSKWGFSLYTCCILSKTSFVKPLSHSTNPGSINI